jgi:accessory gene regulator protein AgrB
MARHKLYSLFASMIKILFNRASRKKKENIGTKRKNKLKNKNIIFDLLVFVVSDILN